MVKVPKSLTTVTPFSKILAIIILVLIIPMASFYAGMLYQKEVTVGQFELPTAVTYGEKMKSVTRELIRNYLTQYLTAKIPLTKRLESYKVYLPDNIIEKNNQLTFEITISVKPSTKQANPFWLNGNGSLQEDGWITGKMMMVTATKAQRNFQLLSITAAK